MGLNGNGLSVSGNPESAETRQEDAVCETDAPEHRQQTGQRTAAKETSRRRVEQDGGVGLELETRKREW